MNNCIVSKKRPHVSRSIVRTWKASHNLTQGRFSQASFQLLVHIGDMLAQREQMDKRRDHSLYQFLESMLAASEDHPTGSGDLHTVLLTDPRAKYHMMPGEWATRLRSTFPKKVEDLYEIWKDTRLGKHQFRVLFHVAAGHRDSVTEYMKLVSERSDMNPEFWVWLMNISKKRCLVTDGPGIPSRDIFIC